MTAYPRRPPYFAHLFVRTLYRNCLAQTIGLEACALLTIIVHAEDAARYRGPVAFYNDRLLDMMGLKKWESLDRARRRAIDAGWLSYTPPAPGRRRAAGLYFVIIPDVCAAPDGPLADDGEAAEAYPPNGYGGSDTTAKAYPPNGDARGYASAEAYPPNGYGEGDAGGESNTLPLALSADPCPAPSSAGAAEGGAPPFCLEASSSEKKPKRSAARASATSAAIAPEAFREMWNRIADVTTCRDMTKARCDKLRARCREPGWLVDLPAALARVAASSFCRGGGDRGWKANVDWLLKEQSVTKLLEGAFDDKPYKHRNGASDGAARVHERPLDYQLANDDLAAAD